MRDEAARNADLRAAPDAATIRRVMAAAEEDLLREIAAMAQQERERFPVFGDVDRLSEVPSYTRGPPDVVRGQAAGMRGQAAGMRGPPLGTRGRPRR